LQKIYFNKTRALIVGINKDVSPGQAGGLTRQAVQYMCPLYFKYLCKCH
jgi:hypothetical protein